MIRMGGGGRWKLEKLYGYFGRMGVRWKPPFFGAETLLQQVVAGTAHIAETMS